MIRFFCDVCGAEITGSASGRLIGRLGRLTVEVMSAIDGVWNGGQVCADCMKKAVAASAEKDWAIKQESG